MQILDRAVDESIVIGGNIEVTVLEVQPEFVRLGILSPKLDPAYREETIYLTDAVAQSQNEFAATVAR